MIQIYYFIIADTAEALESAPIFRVRVGSAARAAAAAAALAARALVGKLMRQNENRAFYDVTISQLKKFINTTANVVHVENLSERIKANRDYLLRTIRGAKTLTI